VRFIIAIPPISWIRLCQDSQAAFGSGVGRETEPSGTISAGSANNLSLSRIVFYKQCFGIPCTLGRNFYDLWPVSPVTTCRLAVFRGRHEILGYSPVGLVEPKGQTNRRAGEVLKVSEEDLMEIQHVKGGNGLQLSTPGMLEVGIEISPFIYNGELSRPGDKLLSTL
jgi:hypothetical protein